MVKHVLANINNVVNVSSTGFDVAFQVITLQYSMFKSYILTSCRQNKGFTTINDVDTPFL